MGISLTHKNVIFERTPTLHLKLFILGKPKGQGQNKDVLTNRHKKNIHKGAQGNHNRRMGSQIKRRQGMIPS